MLISKHCLSVWIAESRSLSLNCDTCCKQAASSKEASPATYALVVCFKNKPLPVNSAQVSGFTGTYYHYYCTHHRQSSKGSRNLQGFREQPEPNE